MCVSVDVVTECIQMQHVNLFSLENYLIPICMRDCIWLDVCVRGQKLSSQRGWKGVAVAKLEHDDVEADGKKDQ